MCQATQTRKLERWYEKHKVVLLINVIGLKSCFIVSLKLLFPGDGEIKKNKAELIPSAVRINVYLEAKRRERCWDKSLLCSHA